jgi:hypothetical protein
VLRAAFSTAVPGDQPVYTGVVIGQSDYAVIRVANVVTPPAAELAKSAVTNVRREMASTRGAVAWDAFLAALRAKSDIKVYTENL